VVWKVRKASGGVIEGQRLVGIKKERPRSKNVLTPEKPRRVGVGGYDARKYRIFKRMITVSMGRRRREMREEGAEKKS